MAPPVTCECGECQKCKHRAYMNEYYRRDPQRIRDIANASRTRRLEAARAYDRERGRRQEAPEQWRAHNTVQRALKDGRLTRGTCSVGIDCHGRIEAHHEDYSLQLDVVWLCHRHHMERHRRIGVVASETF